MIKAIIFDMDGVLFDTERIMKKGWEKALAIIIKPEKSAATT